MSKHTPTPWTVEDHDTYKGTFHTIKGPSFDITYVRYATDISTEDRAQRDQDAAFIVLAVNSHDALVEALRELEGACDLLAATRSQTTYLSMIDNDLATGALALLDQTRSAARAALATVQP